MFKRIIFYFLIVLIFFEGFLFAFRKFYEKEIYSRIYVGENIAIGGLKVEEAEFLIRLLIKKIEKQGFVFKAKTELGEKEIILKTESIALTDPDLSRQLVYFDIQKTINNAFQIGREENLFKRGRSLIESFFKNKKINLVVEIGQEEFIQILEKNFGEMELLPQDAGFKMVKEKLQLVDGKSGFILDYQAAGEILKKQLQNFDNKEIEIPVIFKNPEIKKEELERVFPKVEQIIAESPYLINFMEKKWEIFPSQIISWFNFEKDEFNQINPAFKQKLIIEFLKEISKEVDVNPIKPKLKMGIGRVIEFQAGENGLVLNREKTADLIAQSILRNKKEIPLIIDKIEPESLPEDINSLGIKELVARGVSNFAGSPKNRRENIKVGMEKLHGLLIKPDEEFSLIEAIGPVDEKAGFLPELVIKGDRTVPEYGGGLCQIGTTVFRLVLNAGLPITERSPHSYRVSYYEPAGTDATIYQPHPDLRFINDTGNHLLLQGEIEENNLIFKFYGTSDRRKVETGIPEIYNIVSSGLPRFIETTDLSPGEKRKIESAHAGADAIFKNKITFSNGIVREDIWKSHYRPWSEVWLVGKETSELDSIEPKTE